MLVLGVVLEVVLGVVLEVVLGVVLVWSQCSLQVVPLTFSIIFDTEILGVVSGCTWPYLAVPGYT